jgi:hypothetical protein
MESAWKPCEAAANSANPRPWKANDRNHRPNPGRAIPLIFAFVFGSTTTAFGMFLANY